MRIQLQIEFTPAEMDERAPNQIEGALLSEANMQLSSWAKDERGAGRFDTDCEVWVNGLIYRRGVMVGSYVLGTDEAVYF